MESGREESARSSEETTQSSGSEDKQQTSSENKTSKQIKESPSLNPVLAPEEYLGEKL